MEKLLRNCYEITEKLQVIHSFTEIRVLNVKNKLQVIHSGYIVVICCDIVVLIMFGS